VSDRSTRIIVALSGGVDSAVAALLLRRAGHDVQGLFMHNWEDDDGYCTSAQDFQDARAVAAELGIPLHSVDLSGQYRERVFAHFLAEYRAGRTPNPDVLCNREIKFGDCLAHALRLGGERLATGHYSRIEQRPDGPALLKGVDPGKDQSYFLHAVRRTQFSRALMPLGTYHKAQVRELAREAGLPVHAKRDSTGICFIGERPFREFLSQHLTAAPGPIETPDGQRLGEHVGLPFYTLGQRGGIHLGGLKGFDEAAWYVARKDVARNALIVVQGASHPALFCHGVHAAQVNWLVPAPTEPFEAGVKLRYRQADQAARIEPLAGSGVRITPRIPQRAVTPGQSAVFYDGDRCVGGGVIEQTDI
jgi:tRNA-uridine 2-sulfurtransferase